MLCCTAQGSSGRPREETAQQRSLRFKAAVERRCKRVGVSNGDVTLEAVYCTLQESMALAVGLHYRSFIVLLH